MTNKLSPGANHERRSSLQPLQHEAAVKRWPIRHTGETRAEWAYRTVFGDMVEQPAPVATQPDYQALGSNVVSLETARHERKVTQQPERTEQLDLDQPETDAKIYDFDTIRQELQREQAPGQLGPVSPEAAEADAVPMLDIDAIRKQVEDQAA